PPLLAQPGGAPANTGAAAAAPPALTPPQTAAQAGAPQAVPAPQVPVQQPVPTAPPAAQAPAPTAPVQGPPGAPPGGPAGLGTPGWGQIVVSAPAEFRISGGPYTVPISITGASQISSVSLTITYNPAVLRIMAAQEGTFLRAGGVAAVFNQQPDPAGGRL